MAERSSLASFSLADMIAASTAVRRLGTDCPSVETFAQRVVNHLYDSFVDTDTGRRESVLVRFYQSHPYDGLDAELRGFADAALTGQPPPPGLRCLTLLGTAGREPAWNDRHASRGHRAIPLASVATVSASPMIHRLLQQLGIDVATLVRPDPGLLVDIDEHSYNVFHVAEATGSSYIPAQDFVRDHQVASVVGFGGALPTGEMFAVVLFSRAPISREAAQLFQTVALSTTVALLPLLNAPLLDAPLLDAPLLGAPLLDAEPVPNRGASPRRTDGAARLPMAELTRAQAAVLRRLLSTHERTALAESRAAAYALQKLAEEAGRYATLARTLQDSLIPPELPVIPGLQTAAVYRPAGDGSEVGGDFYDLFPIRRGLWGLVLGDVSGKGAGAAALTALARHTVRAAGLRSSSAAQVLQQLNEAVNRQDSPDERYLTAVYARLQRARGRLVATVALGGHCPPLVLRHDGSVSSAGYPGTALGLFHHAEVAEDTIELDRGDALLLYTDGVTEARADGAQFGEHRLRVLLGTLAGASASTIATRVAQAVLDFQLGVAHDDTALVVVRVSR